MRKALMVEGAVRPAGQYSHVVVANGFAYVSGQGPADPVTNAVPEGFAAQARQALRNLETILKGARLGLRDVVKVNGYLADINQFREYNEIYKEFFPHEPPARTTIACQLVGIQVEIDCIAALPG
ncbi:MAG: RidA family protein [Acetobacteraceae bacterium]